MDGGCEVATGDGTLNTVAPRSLQGRWKVHFYDLLDVLDLLDELHLCHPPDVLELPDRPDHTTETETATTETSAGTATRKGRALFALARPFVVSVNAGCCFYCCSFCFCFCFWCVRSG